MLRIPPFPTQTPFLEEATAKNAPRRVAHSILRWFQQVAQVQIPEFANDTPTPAVNGTATVFYLPTAAPNPVSSLQIYNAGVLVAASAYYLSGQRVTFYTAPTGGPLYATYRY